MKAIKPTMKVAMHVPDSPSAHTELGTLCGGYLLVLIYVTKLDTIRVYQSVYHSSPSGYSGFGHYIGFVQKLIMSTLLI